MNQQLAESPYNKIGDDLLWEGVVPPKISFPIQESILRKYFLVSSIPIEELCNGKEEIYFTRSIRYFRPFYDFIPYHEYANGKKKVPTELKSLSVKEPAKEILCFLNSNLVWHLLNYYTDMRNVNLGFIKTFKAPCNMKSKTFSIIAEELMDDYERNKEIRYNQKTKCNESYYFPYKSKQIIDKIDKLLSQFYGFSDLEVDFIINHDIKYRISRDVCSEEVQA